MEKSLLTNCVRERGTSKVPEKDDRSRTRLSKRIRYDCLSDVDWPRTPGIHIRVHHETQLAFDAVVDR